MLSLLEQGGIMAKVDAHTAGKMFLLMAQGMTDEEKIIKLGWLIQCWAEEAYNKGLERSIDIFNMIDAGKINIDNFSQKIKEARI